MNPGSISSQNRSLTLSALGVVLLLSALDQTIVSTAMPRIIEQLHGLSMYAWVATSYLLTSTVSVPIYGKLSDLYGRKPILLFGVGLFLVGSMLCGLSGEFGTLPVLGDGMMQLIVFRALQGLGGGALMTTTFATVADLYPPRERGRIFGIFGSIFAVATVIGPAIGGFFTDHANFTLFGRQIAGWRWVFYINLPLGMVSLFLIVFRMPALRHPSSDRVDYLGAVLIVLAFTPLLLALSIGGHSYPWNSSRVLLLFATSAVAFVLFVYVERDRPHAIVPLHLFKARSFSATVVAGFLVNMAFLGMMMFMPLYMQLVQGVSATSSGFAMLPLMAGLLVGSVASGRLVSRTGRYRLFLIGGAVVLCIGIVLIAGIGPDTTPRDLAWRMAVTGLGLGPAQSIFSLVIQSSVTSQDTGVATSVGQFSRQIGGTLGVAIFGTLLLHSLNTEVEQHLPQAGPHHTMELGELQSQAMNTHALDAQIAQSLAVGREVIWRAYRGDTDAANAILRDPRTPDTLKTLIANGHAATNEQEAARIIDGALEAQAHSMAERLHQIIRGVFSAAITDTIDKSLWIVLLGLAAVLFIPEVPLRSRESELAPA